MGLWLRASHDFGARRAGTSGSHEQYFRDTSLRHPAVDATFEYNTRDLFAEMIKPLRARRMKIFARILEAGPRGIVNFSNVATVNVYGKPANEGCWNHRR